ncbi:MAG TPA: UDP-3-O-(3-hydroxymyristoyl)glucosamine N-acyltransferase [Steroidobacteraceae bacterium]|nr:UDP-3-O-(3-hydroxymyristoyl)glucosamine N-acyltransferase [Steroidobacteraceae bacterium]
MALSLGELAVRFGCELKGDPDAQVDSVATLQNATDRAVTFLANPRYRRHLAQTRAGAVVLESRFAAECPVAALIAADPYVTYARIAALLFPEPQFPAGVDRSAQVSPQATIAASASIAANVVIEAGVRIGERVRVGPGCVVLADSSIDADTRLVANVTLCQGVHLGARVLLHPGVVIGADGFGLAPERGRWVKVPQVGGVRIGNDVEIGANTTVDRGAIDDTIIEDGVKLDNQIQIGHNVRVGAHTAIAGCTGVSGSTSIGRNCMIGGMVGIAGHLEIGDGVFITGRTLVSRSITRPGTYSGGLPADDVRRWRRNAARFRHLDELARRVEQLGGGKLGDSETEGEDD